MKPCNYRNIAQKALRERRMERARRKIAENNVAALTLQLEGIHLVLATARGNIKKADESFQKLISHYKAEQAS